MSINLKDAFRYQNILSQWIDKVSCYLQYEQNVTKKTQEHLRSKTNQDAVDETIDMSKDRQYPYEINKIIDFMMSLLNEKEKLSDAINVSKKSMSIDMDSSVALNKKRQEIKNVFSRMANIKAFEKMTKSQGYKFNNEGNQTSYTYDVKEVVVIDFDRNKVKAISKKLSKDCDDISSQLDRCIIDTAVEIVPMYDVNDSFEDVLESFCS